MHVCTLKRNTRLMVKLREPGRRMETGWEEGDRKMLIKEQKNSDHARWVSASDLLNSTVSTVNEAVSRADLRVTALTTQQLQKLQADSTSRFGFETHAGFANIVPRTNVCNQVLLMQVLASWTRPDTTQYPLTFPPSFHCRFSQWDNFVKWYQISSSQGIQWKSLAEL